MISYREIKQKVPITTVLEYYRIAIKPCGTQLKATCPSCGHDALKISREKNCFKCFHSSCTFKGNIFDLISFKEKLPINGAAQWAYATFIERPPTLSVFSVLSRLKAVFKAG